MADKSFDRNQWHPVLCKTPAEADLQIADWGLKDKKIKRLNTIGTVRYRESLRLANSGDSFLTATASPDQLIWEGLVFAPCEVEVCEPVVIVFEDDRTLALLPHHTHGLWLAPDQIAPDVVNGTNWSNLDASVFFENVQGKKFGEFEFISRTAKHEKYGDGHSDKIYRITLEYSRSLYLIADWEGWFQVGMMSYTGRIEMHQEWIPIEKARQATIPLQQVEIVEGHDSGGFFWIMPVRLTKDSEWHVEEFYPEEISIVEQDVCEYLAVFLRKYFDKDFPYYEETRAYNWDEFEWYLEHNFYTYDTVNRMLEEIERCCELLARGEDDPVLAPLKESASWLSDDPIRHLWDEPLTDEDRAKLMQEELKKALDFYHRFVRRMRGMMERASDYELISFMGP